MKSRFYLLALIAFAVLSCDNDDDEVNVPDPDPQLEMPALRMPADMAVVNANAFPLKLVWEETSFADFYTVLIADNEAFENAGLALTKDTMISLDSAVFKPNKLNYWKVRAHSNFSFEELDYSEAYRIDYQQ